MYIGSVEGYCMSGRRLLGSKEYLINRLSIKYKVSTIFNEIRVSGMIALYVVLICPASGQMDLPYYVLYTDMFRQETCLIQL